MSFDAPSAPRPRRAPVSSRAPAPVSSRAPAPVRTTMSCRANVLLEALPDDSVVLIDEERRVSCSLNATGRRVWEWLAPPPTMDELVDRLVANYAVDRAVAEGDLLLFLQRLAALGLVTITQLPEAD